MKSTTKTEDGILRAAASLCCVLALTACGVAAYALVALSLTAYNSLGAGLRLASSQF